MNKLLSILSIEHVCIKWTDTMIDRMGVLLEKGHTYSEVAAVLSEEFDCHLTRNACVSRAKRSGIAALNKNLPYISRGKLRAAKAKSFVEANPNPRSRAQLVKFRPRPMRKPHRALDLRPTVLGDSEDAHAKPLIETQPMDCRWPVSPEDAVPMMCCSRPKMRWDVAYCSHHMARSARRVENGGSK